MIVTLLMLVIFIVFICFVTFGVKQSTIKLTEEEREDMVKQVYQYAVAFITLIMVIGGGVFAFMSLADYVSPSPYLETFEEFKSMREMKSEEQMNENQLDEERLQRQYDAMVEQQIAGSKQRALNSFIKSLGWILIPLPIFIFFQRKINRDRRDRI
ncbi:hypothetical protein [Halalkalibacter krulwichiae]|uniref:Uncharacterized protein n=1 Tax=Halalkalibacter krulwichiae TaxID=199441 RepID=A0A1X9MAA4_9BACI|nr:hypothetical protein [Halalkalibacter krulwichiae]ARK29584.1 hypothetical protein BkAM31D_06755 [Halalkalibacter krulwichiae]